MQPAPPVDACVAFVDGLSERQRLAQLLTVGVTGTQDAVQIMSTEQVGGIFIGSWTDESMLRNREVSQVLDASAVAPMVTIDEESWERRRRRGCWLGRCRWTRCIRRPSPAAEG